MTPPREGPRPPRRRPPVNKGAAKAVGTNPKSSNPEASKEVKYAGPDDPHYLDPAYYPVLAPDESWFEARTKQVAAIKVAEAKAQAARAARAAKRKAARAAIQAKVAATTDIINARKPIADRAPNDVPNPADTDGTMPYQDNSPLQAPARVRGSGSGPRKRSARHQASHASLAKTSQILSAFSLSLRQAFPELIPLRPYCANDLDEGIRIRPRQLALAYLHIQFNYPALTRWLVLDIDRRGAYLADEEALLPAFNVVMVNPANGHAHVAYLLDVPVGRHDAARVKPLKLLAAIERGLTRRLGGDRGYVGLLAKNPLHAHWQVEWRRDAPYSLEILASWLSKEDMRPDAARASFGLGRNCAIFDELRAFAYREVLAFKRSGNTVEAWRRRLFDVARTMNGQFSDPLGHAEVRSIAKSVAKWTWKKFSEASFSAIQSKRAMKRWHGHEAESTTKPWIKMGISRRTYYRRKSQNK